MTPKEQEVMVYRRGQLGRPPKTAEQELAYKDVDEQEQVR